ncbi:MAG: ASCH domain-containing protein [Rhodospirillaceae bacterium]
MFVDKSEMTEAFWEDVKRSVPDAGNNYRARRASGNPDFAEIIMNLIITEKKRGLFGLQLLQERQPELAPTLGGVLVLVDFAGIPQGAVKTTKITPVPYKDINEGHLAVEGPDARKLRTWQDIHWPYWTQMLAPYGLTPNTDMIVIIEQFKLIYPT